jgi:gluconate 5-dehydrogenase
VSPAVAPADFRLDGQLALVTGSTRGIGLAIAEGLALAGAGVVLNGRDGGTVQRAAAELAERLRAAGRSGVVAGSAFDVADPAAVEPAVAAVEQRHGPLGILVNNAGIQLRGPLTELPVADWERVLAVDLTACFLVGRAVASRMLPRGRGKILNICSVQNRLVRPTTAAYAAAKGGLGTLTQAMCAEWAGAGLQVNGLAPGYIDTELNAALVADEAFSSWIRGRTPAGRWGTVQDLVGPAVWLCSDAAAFVNGQVIYADGGLTAVL